MFQLTLPPQSLRLNLPLFGVILFLQQGVGDEFESALRVRDDVLHSLQLLLHGVDSRVLCHDVTVVGRVWAPGGLGGEELIKPGPFSTPALLHCFPIKSRSYDNTAPFRKVQAIHNTIFT